jgi:hypothetical protein
VVNSSAISNSIFQYFVAVQVLTSYKPDRLSAPSWHARSLSASPGGSHAALGQEEDETAGLRVPSRTSSSSAKKACEYTGVPGIVVGVAQRPHRTG